MQEKTVYRSLHLCPMASVGINNGKTTMTYPDNTTVEEKLSKTFTVETALNRLYLWFKGWW